MSLFKQVKKIDTEEPSSIEFKNKKFYLSGNFTMLKKDFGKQLETLGAIHMATFTIRDTDYLILAEDGVRRLGEKKPHGDNAKRVQAHNEKPNQNRHIPIIKEAHCQKIIGASLGNRPKKL